MSTEYQCIDCGSPSKYIITDSIKDIFRMEEVHFPCGAIQTISHVDRWQASKVLNEGCTAKASTFPC